MSGACQFCGRPIEREGANTCARCFSTLDEYGLPGRAPAGSEAATRQREDLGKPRLGYPGDAQMAAWQREYK